MKQFASISEDNVWKDRQTIYTVFESVFSDKNIRISKNSQEELTFCFRNLDHFPQKCQIVCRIILTYKNIMLDYKICLHEYWKQICQQGLAIFQNILNSIRFHNNPSNVLSFDKGKKQVNGKLYYSVEVEASAVHSLFEDFKKFLFHNLLPQLLNFDSKSSIDPQIKVLRQNILFNRNQRFKSSSIPTSVKIDERKLNAYKTIRIQTKKIFLKKLKKVEVPHVFSQILEVQSDIDEDWSIQTDCRNSFEKRTVKFIYKNASLHTKTANAIIKINSQREINQQVYEQDEAEDVEEILNQDEHVKFLVRKYGKKDLCFEVEKAVLYYLRFERCSFLNSFYVTSEEAQKEDKNLIEFIYSDYQKKVLKTNQQRFLIQLKIIRTFLEGILFLHSHGFSHRDIKPDNVLLSNDFTCKLIDFGSCCAQRINLCLPICPLFTNQYYNLLYQNLSKGVKSIFNQVQFERNNNYDLFAVGRILEELAHLDLREEGGIIFSENIDFLINQCKEENPQDRPEVIDVYCLFIKLIKHYK